MNQLVPVTKENQLPLHALQQYLLNRFSYTTPPKISLHARKAVLLLKMKRIRIGGFSHASYPDSIVKQVYIPKCGLYFAKVFF